jgi:predicted transcriptional regulator
MATFMSEPSDPITVTGGIVSAFVAHNSWPSAELPSPYLVCLDDGLKFKSLRRHLTALGMTPEFRRGHT